jgi:plasmid stabilization system protein ParE
MWWRSAASQSLPPYMTRRIVTRSGSTVKAMVTRRSKPTMRIIAPDARDDLNSLYDWIAGAASPGVALGYIERIGSGSTVKAMVTRRSKPTMRRPGRMSSRLVPRSATDLNSLYDWIAGAASPGVALGYIERIERHLSGFDADRGAGVRSGGP